MLPALFAILAAVSAWTTWRHNPLYSTRSTLRAAVVVLLALASVAGIDVAAISLTIHRSPAVIGVAMAAVIVFSALSLIFVIQAVTTPAAAKLATALPPAAKLVHVHRRKVYRWAKISAVVLPLCGLAGFALPDPARYVPWTLGGISLLLAAVLLPVGYFTARNFDRSLTALELDPWVHWRYQPEQWNLWVGVQVERARAAPPEFTFKRDWRKLAGVLGSIAAGVLLFSPGTWLEKTLYTLFVCGVLFALVESSVRDRRRAPEKLRARLLMSADPVSAGPEAYFGRDGMFCDGIFTTWLSLNVYLTSASIDPRQPPSLMFRFDQIVPNPYAGNPVVPVEHSVLIPPGAEADVLRLHRELTVRCPKARIALA